VVVEQLRDKVAVVTGAASGIGRAVVDTALATGMRVVLADIEEAALAEAESAWRAAGGDVLAVVTDVSSGEAMEALRDRAVAAYGAVHLVHLNAGVGAGGLLWDIPVADWQWLLGVNLWGVIHGIRAFVPLLIEQGEGHVVNTASIAGMVAPAFMGAYSASKHAVVAISETLARELRFVGSPVGVSVLCPGFVRTRIDEADRNRPASAPVAGPEDDDAAAVRAVFHEIVQAGMDPAAVGAAVIDAVRANRFYILTHAALDPLVGLRAGDVGAGAQPADVDIV
jgi:NAD(P)-dependent dehydrogenase (short-subunit alcohol dehydrogenase family)